MKNITKTFPGVKALDNVNLEVEEGKSTRWSEKTERESQPL
jgi:ABC-type sugar transport system ATPase subunit